MCFFVHYFISYTRKLGQQGGHSGWKAMGCPCWGCLGCSPPSPNRTRRNSFVSLLGSVFSLFPFDLNAERTTNIQVSWYMGSGPWKQFGKQSLVLSPIFGTSCSKFPSGFGASQLESLLAPLCKVDLNRFSGDVVGEALVRPSASSPASFSLLGGHALILGFIQTLGNGPWSPCTNRWRLELEPTWCNEKS